MLRCRKLTFGHLFRFSQVYEQAAPCVFLLSKYSSYTTGSSNYVDGGQFELSPVTLFRLEPVLMPNPCWDLQHTGYLIW